MTKLMKIVEIINGDHCTEKCSTCILRKCGAGCLTYAANRKKAKAIIKLFDKEKRNAVGTM